MKLEKKSLHKATIPYIMSSRDIVLETHCVTGVISL